MDPQCLHDLIEGYLERRLTDGDCAALNQALRDSSEARLQFWEQIYQHALLAELLAESRGRDLAAEESLLRVAELRCPAGPAPRRHPTRRWRVSLVAALVLVGISAWLLRSIPMPTSPSESGNGVAARLIDLQGEVFISDGPARVAAWAGQILHPGQEVQTGPEGSAVVRFDDSSRIELHPDTAVRLLDSRPTDSAQADKRLFLVKGLVNANVGGKALILRTLQADLLAPRGRFSSTTLLDETRVEMEEGSATLARVGEQEGIEIRSGTYSVAAGEPGIVRTAPMLPTGTVPAAILTESSGPVVGMAVLTDGPTLAYSCATGQVKLWSLITRRPRGVLEGPPRKVLALAVAPDGNRLAVGYEPTRGQRDGLIIVWDGRKQKPLHILDIHRRVQSLTFTPDSQSLALTTGERSLRGTLVWDLGDSRERLQLGDRTSASAPVALAPDGRTLATGGRDGLIRLHDIQTGRPVGVLAGHQREVQSLAFQPSGDLLASGSRDGTIRLWSVNSLSEVRSLSGKFNEVRCLTFSPDGQTLASGHAGIAILWDANSGTQRTALRAHKFAISSILYLPDGRTLATAGWDRTVKLWDLHPAFPN